MNGKYFIEGEGIYLREVRLSDVNDEYYSWLNDFEINRYLETRFVPRSKENIGQFVKNLDGNSNEILLAICDKQSDTHIGNIKLGPINWIHRFADISLLIGNKTYWGKGLATQSIGVLTKFAFEELNLHKVKAGCYIDNEGSKKAFLKVGYTIEGRLRNHFFSNGSYQDGLLLGILKSEFYENK